MTGGYCVLLIIDNEANSDSCLHTHHDTACLRYFGLTEGKPVTLFCYLLVKHANSNELQTSKTETSFKIIKLNL